ncbi:MAG: tyrosine-type recombinase/integrase, partial [Syntrophothermus sp.]
MLSEIEQFIDWVRIRSPQAKTWRDYRCDLDLFVRIIGDPNAGEIQPGEIDRFVGHQLEQGCKASTINRRLAAVGSFYKYLIAEGRAAASPVLPKRHCLRQPQRLPRPVSEQELRRFFGAVDDVRDRAMFTMMLHCGLRIGEVSTLQMKDLYLDELPSRLILPGKGARERTVYLSQPAEQALHAWLAQRPVVRDGHVFLSYQHKRISTTSISLRIKRVCQSSGVHLTAHRLRHTFADHLLSAGMPITSIQALMGHRFVETTQNYAAANDKQVQLDFYKACSQLDG